MPQHRPAACAFSIRRGFLSLEILLSLPVVALLLVGLFEFSCLSCGYGSVARASQAGARIAARPGTSVAEVSTAVEQSLGESLAADAEIRCEPADAQAVGIVCRVRVPMTACAPNLLWLVGFDLQGRFIECRAHTPLAAAPSSRD